MKNGVKKALKGSAHIFIKTTSDTMKLLALLMLLPTAASFTINQLNHHLNPGRAPGLSPTRTNRLSRVPKLNAGGGAAAGVEQYDGVRIGPPPDLPSLLLHNRIVYIGMPLVPAVTELIIAELLYLNYESSDKPIYMYINSSGTLSQDGRPVGFETEAFAIADCIRYIKPPVHTIALGQAQGAAAMLLGMGKKGFRYALPNAVITLTQPKGQARGQASDIAIRAKEVMANKKVTCDLIAKATGKSIEEVEKDCQRVKYFDGEEAKDYGLVDKVLHSTKDLPVEPSFLS